MTAIPHIVQPRIKIIRLRALIKDFKELGKWNIVLLVLISTAVGYLMGQSLERPFYLFDFALTLTGIFLLALGSAALNQIQERDTDAQMPRTQNRPLPAGRLSLRTAYLFSGLNLFFGCAILYTLSNAIFWSGICAIVTYNLFYTLFFKPKMAFAAVPGAIPGALPILMGYFGADPSIFSSTGWYLFSILFFWQMPHFWSLALKYRADYAKGNIPTLPVARGVPATVSQIIVWCLAYLAILSLAPVFIQSSVIYMCIALPVSAKLLWELVRFTKNPVDQSWLRFFLWINFSLIIYLMAMVIDRWWSFWFQSWVIL